MYSKVIQLYIYMYLLFFKFLSHLGYFNFKIFKKLSDLWFYHIERSTVNILD